MEQVPLRIVTIIVQRKVMQKVVDACTNAGAGGVTFFYGQGTGVRQKLGFLGNFIDAEKGIVQVVGDAETAKKVMAAAVTAANLDKPGNGFAYVQEVLDAVGFVSASAASKA